MPGGSLPALPQDHLGVLAPGSGPLSKSSMRRELGSTGLALAARPTLRRQICLVPQIRALRTPLAELCWPLPLPGTQVQGSHLLLQTGGALMHFQAR